MAGIECPHDGCTYVVPGGNGDATTGALITAHSKTHDSKKANGEKVRRPAIFPEETTEASCPDGGTTSRPPRSQQKNRYSSFWSVVTTDSDTTSLATQGRIFLRKPWMAAIRKLAVKKEMWSRRSNLWRPEKRGGGLIYPPGSRGD